MALRSNLLLFKESHELVADPTEHSIPLTNC